MNIEVCKKCLLGENKSEMKLLVNFNGTNRQTDFIEIHTKKKLKSGFSIISCECQKFVGRKCWSGLCYNINENDFNNVELIDKSCPYYLEHTLSDWNK